MRTTRNKRNSRPYKKEIEAPWVIEIISEKFDNAIELMTDNCVIYGGAVRDALAELPLLGDLDIAVSQVEDIVVKTRFLESVKWRQMVNKKPPRPHKGKEVPVSVMKQTLRDNYRKVGESTEQCLNRLVMDLQHREGRDYTMLEGITRIYYGGAPKKYKPTYQGGKPQSYGGNIPSAIPISTINTYKGIDDTLVQIMRTKRPETIPGQPSNNFDDLARLARLVDIKCCGVVMNKNGQIFEVVEGAYEECKSRLLNINPVIVDEALNIANLETRVLRLVERGWTSNIDLEELKTEVTELKVAADKKAKAKRKRQESHRVETNKSRKMASFDTYLALEFMGHKLHDAQGNVGGYGSYGKGFSYKEIEDYYGGASNFIDTIEKKAKALKVTLTIENNSDYDVSIRLRSTNKAKQISRRDIRSIYEPTQTPPPPDKKESKWGFTRSYPPKTRFEDYAYRMTIDQLNDTFGTVNSKRIRDMLIERCAPRNISVDLNADTLDGIIIRLTTPNRHPMDRAEIAGIFEDIQRNTSIRNKYVRASDRQKNPYTHPGNDPYAHTRTFRSASKAPMAGIVLKAPGVKKKQKVNTYSFSAVTIKRAGGIDSLVREVRVLLESIGIKHDFRVHSDRVDVKFYALRPDDVTNILRDFGGRFRNKPTTKSKPLKKESSFSDLKANKVKISFDDTF